MLELFCRAVGSIDFSLMTCRDLRVTHPSDESYFIVASCVPSVGGRNVNNSAAVTSLKFPSIVFPKAENIRALFRGKAEFPCAPQCEREAADYSNFKKTSFIRRCGGGAIRMRVTRLFLRKVVRLRGSAFAQQLDRSGANDPDQWDDPRLRHFHLPVTSESVGP